MTTTPKSEPSSMPNWVSSGVWNNDGPTSTSGAVAPTLEASTSPTTGSDSSNSTKGSGGGINFTGIIALIVVVFLVLVIGLACGIWFVRREKRRKERKASPQSRSHQDLDVVTPSHDRSGRDVGDVVAMTELQSDGRSLADHHPNGRALSRSSSLTSFGATQVDEGGWKAVEARSVV